MEKQKNTMDIILKTGFSEIKHNIPFKKRTTKNGEKLAFRHVCDVTERMINGERIISADCVRTTSQSKKEYKVRLKVKNEIIL